MKLNYREIVSEKELKINNGRKRNSFFLDKEVEEKAFESADNIPFHILWFLNPNLRANMRC